MGPHPTGTAEMRTPSSLPQALIKETNVDQIVMITSVLMNARALSIISAMSVGSDPTQLNSTRRRS